MSTWRKWKGRSEQMAPLPCRARGMGPRWLSFSARSRAAFLGGSQAIASFPDVPEQKDAWVFQLGFLKTHLSALTGSLYLEFGIPRMGRRIDAVVLSGPVVLVVEFITCRGQNEVFAQPGGREALGERAPVEAGSCILPAGAGHSIQWQRIQLLQS
jgi:hypothetical protein